MKRRDLPFLLLLIVFFFSGAMGLVYEVVWTRMLTLVVGHTIHAVSTVLAAFMGGLALGSWWFGRTADRRGNPLAVYALLELGIGAFALLVPWTFGHLDAVFGPLYRGLAGHFALFSAVRFGACFVLLLVPTVMMGATLPILVRAAATRGEALGGRIGRLYAINTLGAVAGCFAAGFFLIEWLGTSGTIYFAGFVNALAAVAALGLAPWFRTPGGAPAAAPVEAPAEAVEVARPWLLPVVYGVSGFVALALEVAWTRALIFSFFSGATTYAFATMLTVFLVGLGAGSMIAASWVDRVARRMRLLTWAELVIGATALLSAPALVWLADVRTREGTEASWLLATLRDLSKSALVMLVPTLAMGAIFPVLARVYVTSRHSAGRGVGRLYFANTIGAILGSLVSGFLLVPRLGIQTTILVLAVVSFALACVLAANDLRAGRGEKWGTAALAATALALVLVTVPLGRPIQRIGKGEKLLFYDEGSAGTVAVVETPAGERRLQIDNVHIAGDNSVMRTAHKSLAHVGVLLHPQAKDVLTVGFASGGTSRSFTLHPSLARIDCVEIADTVLEARSYFSDLNGGVMEDPRYRVVLEDARTFLLLGDRRYDIISTDCTDLAYKSDASLYSVDYFDLCRRKLNDDGVLVVFLPFGGLNDDVFRGVLGTFQRVFPEGTVWYLNNQPTHYFLLVGTKGPLEVDWAAFRREISVPAVSADLAGVGLADPYKLLSAFLLDAPTLGRLVAGAVPNTAEHPWVEFAVPRQAPMGALDNLERLLDYAPPAAAPVTGMTPAEEATLARYVRAARRTLRGHVHLSRQQFDQARIDYEDALALTPGDQSLERVLDIGEEARTYLTTRIAADPKNREAKLALGRLERKSGNWDAAEAIFREALAADPEAFSARMGLAVTLEKSGRVAEAQREFAAAAASKDAREASVARQGEALAARRAALLEKPDDQGFLDLAAQYGRIGDLYEAIRLLERRAAEQPTPQILEGLASLYLQAGMSDHAIEAARRLVDLAPQNAAGPYYLLDAYLKQGRLDEAEAQFEAARRLDDKNASLWFNAARLARLRGRDADCVEALRKTLALGGPSALALARQDPILAGSPPVQEVWQAYVSGAGGTGRPK